jgi:hypothetical protein
MRPTTDRVPHTSQGFKDSGMPFGLVTKPFGDLSSVSKIQFA